LVYKIKNVVFLIDIYLKGIKIIEREKSSSGEIVIQYSGWPKCTECTDCTD